PAADLQRLSCNVRRDKFPDRASVRRDAWRRRRAANRAAWPVRSGRAAVSWRLLSRPYGIANPGAHFDHGLVHLRLDLLLQPHLSIFQDFGMYVRAQVAADRVDGLVFLFDSDGESGQHRTTFLEQAMTAAGWPPRGVGQVYTSSARGGNCWRRAPLSRSRAVQKR